MKYIAELDHVLEVSLHGLADLQFWRDWLRPEGLVPVSSKAEGRAQLCISGANSKFRGIRFRELSIAILACRQESSSEPDGLYLAQAFNSSRLFTFFERHWFSTPYAHAKVEVAQGPCRMGVQAASEPLVRATMSESVEEAMANCRPESWEGAIYLPSAKPASRSQRRLFFARLAGETFSHPFRPEVDSLKIAAAPQFPILGALLDSGFQGTTWSIRADAQHARSQTYLETAASENTVKK